jgi:hypothetical protein
MAHLRTYLALALSGVWAASAVAQPDFKAYPSTETSTEGGVVSILVIQTENERFQVRIPKGYGAQVHQNDQSVVFTSQSGKSAITMKMSANYPGTLPKMEILRDEVARKYSTASLVQSSTCYTACGQGLLFDLFQPAAGNLTMRIRDAFVSFAEGSFEFTLTCDSRDYDENRLSFAWLLNSFRLQPQSAKTNS